MLSSCTSKNLCRHQCHSAHVRSHRRTGPLRRTVKVSAGFDTMLSQISSTFASVDLSDSGTQAGLAIPVSLLAITGAGIPVMENKLEKHRIIAEEKLGIDCSDVPTAAEVKELAKTQPGAEWFNTPSKRYGVVAMRICWKLAEQRCNEEGLDGTIPDVDNVQYQKRYVMLKERLAEKGIDFNGYTEMGKLR
ncbi:hypothetical protein PPROV_000908200 [Pycnococcus provasolii]|uniref:Uncharacterized protein n=1 Tax=Pycnococcus provasolii TaxID=41880 RepID=A0A830HY47_9CHLO|nr:hypothetical protein PPROV_000908200 [Pycnococcus provasolii]|mmetsp:Transcript_8217/g.18802  ORF Transcript_8217/g.18802 Transcript_8217/m.18802 type:complete len:191 (+) Transcript_8217:50-622(+)